MAPGPYDHGTACREGALLREAQRCAGAWDMSCETACEAREACCDMATATSTSCRSAPRPATRRGCRAGPSGGGHPAGGRGRRQDGEHGHRRRRARTAEGGMKRRPGGLFGASRNFANTRLPPRTQRCHDWHRHDRANSGVHGRFRRHQRDRPGGSARSLAGRGRPAVPAARHADRPAGRHRRTARGPAAAPRT